MVKFIGKLFETSHEMLRKLREKEQKRCKVQDSNRRELRRTRREERMSSEDWTIDLQNKGGLGSMPSEKRRVWKARDKRCQQKLPTQRHEEKKGIKHEAE